MSEAIKGDAKQKMIWNIIGGIGLILISIALFFGMNPEIKEKFAEHHSFFPIIALFYLVEALLFLAGIAIIYASCRQVTM